MRRIVLLLVVALVGAGFAGRLVAANALRVNSETLSATTLRSELSAISASPSFSCYLASLLNVNTTSNASTFAAAGVASWTRIQIEGLALEGYVSTKYGWHSTAAQLSEARLEYVNDLQNAAASASNSCPATASQALASMPSWFVTQQLTVNAASLELIKHLAGITALNVANVESFFAAHRAGYQNICITVSIIAESSQTAFAFDEQHGMGIAALARKYSVDSNASKGGAYGCFAPNNPNYPTVRDYSNGTALNHYPSTPRVDQTSTGLFLVYVAPTKRTAATLAQAAGLVVSDIRSANAAVASIAEGQILQAANVVIDPAFAKWSTSSLNTVPLSQPPVAVTPNAGAGLGI